VGFRKNYGRSGFALTGLGIASIATGLGIGASCCPAASMMLGTCALPTVLGLTGAVLTAVGSGMWNLKHKEANALKVAGATAAYFAVYALLGAALCYAPWHVGLGPVLAASYSAGAALAIEASIGSVLGILIGGLLGLAIFDAAEAEAKKNNKTIIITPQAHIGGICLGAVLGGLAFAAATTLGPALTMTMGAVGSEAVAMECFISISSMALLVPIACDVLRLYCNSVVVTCS